MNPAPKVLVLIPAFNEENRLGAVVEAVRREGFPHVAVIDDGSSDDTRRVAREAGAVVLPLPLNLGYGRALQTGYKWAAAHDYDVVIQIDADGQHLPGEMHKLLKLISEEDADIAIGSRFQSGYRMPLARRLGARWFSFLIRLLAGQKVDDPTSGMQALSRWAFVTEAGEDMLSDYRDADVIIEMLWRGARIRSVPVVMRPSEGPSMHGGILKPMLYVFVLSLGILAAILRRITLGVPGRRVEEPSPPPGVAPLRRSDR